MSIRETAKRFHISSAFVTRWLSRIEVKSSSPRRRKLDKVALAKVALAKDVALYPDAYQRERAVLSGVPESHLAGTEKPGCHL